MTDLKVDRHSEDGALVVDSRLIAEELGINHGDWMRNVVAKYQKETEQAFGHLRFENGTVTNSVGAINTVKFVYLTEDQATFLMTLSTNTSEVVRCKVLLVTQFSQARRLLAEQGYEQIPHTSVYIRRLEQTFDHNIDYDKWSTFKEGSEILLLIEKKFCVPVEQMDLCDGSIGKHWSKYREGKEWATDSGWYIHNFRDRRGSRECKAYQYSELPHFRKWLKEVYEEKHLPKYLADKYGKRAVLQIYQEQDKVSDYIFSITEEKRPGIKQDELYEVFLAAREVLTNRRLQGN
jgi:phage regulator Rha-like protein